MSDYGFKGGIGEYGSYLPTEQLEGNLTAWLNWALLEVGAYENVGVGQPGAYGGDRSRLQPAADPRFPAGTVWQAHRGDWCWESGILRTTQPIQCSGLWVSGTFYPTSSTTGTYAHYVNYPLGQVFFQNAVPTGTVIQAAYSPRFVSVRRSDEPWFQSLLAGSLRTDDPQWGPNSSGAWAVPAQNRIQLPCLVVESVLNGTGYPYELGNEAQIYSENFLVHVFAETPWDRKRLNAMLVKQRDKRIPSFDRNAAPLPLDPYGRPTPSALTYPQLCQTYPWLQIRVPEVTSHDNENIGRKVWWSTVRLTLEVDGA
jgi:hypothetical protein